MAHICLKYWGNVFLNCSKTKIKVFSHFTLSKHTAKGTFITGKSLTKSASIVLFLCAELLYF